VFSDTESKEKTDTFDMALKDNYGHAGIIYIQYVMQNLDSVRNLVLATQKLIDRKAGLTSENRFWSAGAACTIAGARIACHLGLVDYDLKGLFAWTIALLKANKVAVEDMGVSVEQTLTDYLTENYNNILILKSTDDLRSTSGNGLDNIVIPDALPKGKLVARYETDTKKAYIVPKFLKSWCAAHQIDYSAFVEGMMKNMGGKRVQMRLGKGTHAGSMLPNSRVIAVDCNLFGDTTESEDNLYDTEE
jgi:hypothetical protein